MKYYITSSIVLYNTSKNDLSRIIECVNQSIISKLYLVDNSPTNYLQSYIENKEILP